MEIKILGTLEARHNDSSIVPTAWKPRQVLSLLAVGAGRLVPMSTMVDELWGAGDTPRKAVQVVQTYVLQLRQRIDGTTAGAGKRLLVTRPGGYTLDIAADDVDVHRFERLAVAGERALASGDNVAAADLLGAALDVWRGPTLVDVRVGAHLEVEVERLEQRRLGVLKSRIEADLRLGRHHQLVGELAELAARHPLDEKLCAQYMRALYRCGCKWRALEVFQRLRQRLVDELGIEPSLEVRQVQRAILVSDAELDAVVPHTPVPLGATGSNG